MKTIPQPGKAAMILLPLLLTACIDASPTEAGLEARILGLFGGQAVGEAVILRGAEAGTIYLTGADRSRYVFIPFFAAEGGETRLRINVEGEQVGGGIWLSRSGGLPMPPEIDGRAPALALRGEDEHLRMLARQRRELGARLSNPQWRAALAAAPRANVAAAQAVPAVGEVVPIRVGNPASANLCVNPLLRQGRVEAVTQRAILVMDTRDPALPPERLAEIGREFDAAIHPVLVQNFGEPTDLDGNGRVTIFFTSLVNQMGALGFFFVGDLFPRGFGSPLPGSSSPSNHCPASNEGEIFYVVGPDAETTSEEVVEVALSTLAHEYQHLINASRRIYVNNARDLEEVWLDEGLSHMAEELMFYHTTPFSPRQNLDERQLFSTAANTDAFFRYGYFNAVRYYRYLENPDEESLMAVEDKLETRGATWSFLRYAADHIERSDDSFFRALANSRISGLENLREVLGSEPVDLMQTWTVSNYADDYVAFNPAPFRQPSWNFRRIFPIGFRVPFPLKVHTLQGTGAIDLHLRGGGAAYIEVAPAEGRTGVVTTTAAGVAPPHNLRVTAVRVR